jgi:hypothetical protein
MISCWAIAPKVGQHIVLHIPTPNEDDSPYLVDLK